MKIWLDDLRDPNAYGRNDMLWITKPEFVIKLIGRFDEISFDHDLGTELTGYDVAKEIEKAAWSGKLKKMPLWKIHSANPIGSRRIKQAMMSAEKGYNEYNKQNTM